MPITYDVKTDYLYKMGKNQGKAEGKTEGKVEERQNSQMRFCIQLLETKLFPIAKIAEMTETSNDFVREVEQFLEKKKAVILQLNKKIELAKITKSEKVSLLFIKAIQHFEKQKNQGSKN